MAFFGQPSLAAYLPLSAGQNLADVPDKAAALSNLGTLSTSNIMLNSVPMGTIIPYWGSSAPVGYLPCNGQVVNSATYPDLVTFLGGTTSATLPDLRGEFLRGWDNGRGVDIGRAVNTAQAESIKQTSLTSATGSVYVTGGAGTTANITTGGGQFVLRTASDLTVGSGSETRPRNVSVLYCIKAYGALINTSTVNIGNVLTELSNCTKLTQFGVSLSSSGYQRMPGGLIIQWGTTPILSANASGVVTYPIVFPTLTLSFTATGGATSAGVGSLGSDISGGSNLAGATVWAGASGALAGRFIAIGY